MATAHSLPRQRDLGPGLATAREPPRAGGRSRGRKDSHPPRPLHLLRILHPDPLMGFQVLLGESI